MANGNTSLISLENKEVRNDIVSLLKDTIKHHMQAKKALENFDNSIALEVIQNEGALFAKYINIESNLAFNITKAPVDKNLRRTLAYLSISRQISNIARYANSVAKFVIGQDKKPAATSKSRILSVHDLVMDQLKKLEKVLAKEDAKAAIELAQLDEKIDKQVQKIRKSIISSVSSKTNKDAIDERIYVLNVANSLERAGDYIVKICEFIIYIQTGNHTRI